MDKSELVVLFVNFLSLRCMKVELDVHSWMMSVVWSEFMA
jgi:hypothetical protein